MTLNSHLRMSMGSLTKICLPRSLRLTLAPPCLQSRQHAQGVAGSVPDPTGNVLHNVQITARNLSTNATRVMSTSNVRTYSITNLSPGSYAVIFEKPGFSILKCSHVVVTVAEVVPLNAEFTIRAAAETVGVTSPDSELLRGGQS